MSRRRETRGRNAMRALMMCAITIAAICTSIPARADIFARWLPIFAERQVKQENSIVELRKAKKELCPAQADVETEKSCNLAFDSMIVERDHLVVYLQATIAATKIESAKRDEILKVLTSEDYEERDAQADARKQFFVRIFNLGQKASLETK